MIFYSHPISIMLSSSTSFDWLIPDVWTCLASIMASYFTKTTVEIHSESPIPSIIVSSSQWTYYVSNHFQSSIQPVTVDAVLISKSFENVYMNGRYNRVIVVTRNMDSVTTLWTRSKILETVVIVPNQTHVNAYTWYPYRKEICFDKPILEFINTCENGKWNTNLFPNKLPSQFSGCPVYYFSSHSPPDNIFQDGKYIGREPAMMQILAEALNLSVHYKPSSFGFYDFGEEGDGLMARIYRGDIDFGFASIVLALDFYDFSEPLPSYREQPIAWMLPLPKPQSRVSRIYSGFTWDMWISIVIVAVISGLLIMAIASVERCGWNWVDLMAVLVAAPIATYNSRFLRWFLLYFQFYSLHIAWFYQAKLLQNLVNPPMQKQLLSAEEAIDAKLPVYLYEWMIFTFNHTDHNLWNRVLSPLNHKFTFNIPYDEIVNDKDAFLLGAVVRDAYTLRLKYKRSLANMVHLVPYLNSPIVIYGHRGSPLTAKYNDIVQYATESGIFWHITLLEPGYTDLPGKEVTTSAEVLQIEPLQGAFFLLAGLLLIALVVFVAEVGLVFCNKFLRRYGCLKQTRNRRKIMNIN